jgi:hypothetical protein
MPKNCLSYTPRISPCLVDIRILNYFPHIPARLNIVAHFNQENQHKRNGGDFYQPFLKSIFIG